MKRHNLTEKIPTYQHTYPPTYLPASFTEHPQGAILKTCDLWDIWSEWWGDMTWPKIYPATNIPTQLPTSFTKHPQGAILETCDLWDTDYNSDNWDPEFMTIFVTSQLRVTLDSIRNSCAALHTLNTLHYFFFSENCCEWKREIQCLFIATHTFKCYRALIRQKVNCILLKAFIWLFNAVPVL